MAGHATSCRKICFGNPVTTGGMAGKKDKNNNKNKLVCNSGGPTAQKVEFLTLVQ